MAAKNKKNKDGEEPVHMAALENALRLCSARPKATLPQALAELGHPPSSPGERHQRLSSDLGDALRRHGRIDELMDLVGRGWAKALFPTQRWGDPFDSIAARGAQGYACLDALDAAGVKFFGGAGKLDHGSSPLCSAAKRLDLSALSYFIEKMDSQKASAARVSSERGRLAEQALPDKAQRALISPMIKADPKGWARSLDDRSRGALSTALEKGLLELADAMLAADPGSIALADPTRCGFCPSPVKTLDLLVKHGVDLKKLGWRGNSALHTAMFAHKQSKSLAAKLIALGADPRSTNDEGSTPIGNATPIWTWADMQKTLGATAKDLLDSQSQSSTHGVGAIPTLIVALGQLKFSEAKGSAAAGADSRMAEIVMAASADPRARSSKFIEEGIESCAEHGLPICLASFVELGAKHGAPLRAGLLSKAVNGLPMGAAQEAGRLACLKWASKMGVDLNDAYALQGSRWQHRKTTLIEQALEGAVSHSDPGSGYFEPMARKARLLAELGCDPSKAACANMEWSFDPNGIGREKLNAAARLEFEAIDAMAEAQSLRRSLGDAPPKRKAKSLRV